MAWLIWLVLPCFVAGMLADEVSATLWWILLAGLVAFPLAGAMVTAKMMDHRRAARHPITDGGEVRLEEWGDHLAEYAAGGSRIVRMEMIGKVIVTPAHVFVCGGRFPVIVPRAAFEDEQDMRSFAGWLDEASLQAQP